MQEFCLTVIVCNLPFLLRQLYQLILDLKQSVCHIIRICILINLYQICLFYDFFYQKVFYYLSGSLIIRLKISPDMSLCLIDSPDDLPVALIQSELTDISLIFPLAVKYLYRQLHVPSAQLF